MIRYFVLLCCGLLHGASSDQVLIRLTDGTRVQGEAALTGMGKLPAGRVLSIHSAAPASDFENQRIQSGLAAIQGTDRKARDLAVQELTEIGLPVLTPLLRTYKDTDQREPRPLYRLFERIIPSYADDFDRTLSMVRLEGGSALRIALPDGAVAVKKADGSRESIPWGKIRSLAVRRKLIRREMPVHSLRHSTPIEYLDTGVVLTSASRVDIAANGFVRLSWNEDGWASAPDGLKKPGSPSYKTNLVAGHPFGALVGRVNADGEVFFAGKKFTKTGLPEGRLGLAINDNNHWQNNVGTYTVTMSVTDAFDVGDAQ